MRLTAVTGEQKETVIPFMLTSDIPSGVQFSGFKAGRKFIHILIRSYIHFSLSLIKSLERLRSGTNTDTNTSTFHSRSRFRRA